MRVLPLALWHTGSDEELAQVAHLQSLPTHAHPRSLVACALLCMVGRGYLRKLDDPWKFADSRLEEIYKGIDGQDRQALLRELDVLRNFLTTEQPRGTGYRSQFNQVQLRRQPRARSDQSTLRQHRIIDEALWG